MNCAFHPEVENAAFCIKCGKALCAQCVRQVQSSIYCESCLAESLGETTGTAGSASRPIPPLVQTAGGGSPEAAFLLGLIPGVGAIFNAEYFKAALHLLIFGTLVTAADQSVDRDRLSVSVAPQSLIWLGGRAVDADHPKDPERQSEQS